MNNRQEYMKDYYIKNKDNIIKSKKEYRYKKLYDLTTDQVNAMRKQQNYCCASCNTHESEFKYGLCVDHDHTTGRVRDLLCTNCNTMFGLAKENINIMYSLINYAIKHKKG